MKDSKNSIIKRITAYMKNEFFNENYPLKYHIFSIVFLETLLLSVVSAITNTLLGKGALGIVFQWAFVLFCVVLLLSSSQRRMAASHIMILVTAFIYIPFMYFQTAGYDGTALLFTMLLSFILAYFFSGKARVVIIILSLLEFLACIYIQYNFPQFIVSHGSVEAKIIDTVVALVLCFGGMAVMTIYVNNAYEKELSHSKQLIEQVQSANEQLEILTNRDALTGVYNRRYVDDYLIRELEACRENQRNLTVLIFDLDFFKRVNDTYGHSFGDLVLKQVAQTIADNLRESDVFARFGGEEFIAVLHGDVELSIKTAERLRIAVSEISFRNGLKMTLSIGVATLTEDDSVQTLFDRADANLYKAKESGRNKVVYS